MIQNSPSNKLSEVFELNQTMITTMVLNKIAKILNEQDKKGNDKYGKTLDAVFFTDYDWNEMAMEELADCIKYLMMENVKLRREIEQWKKNG